MIVASCQSGTPSSIAHVANGGGSRRCGGARALRRGAPVSTRDGGTVRCRCSRRGRPGRGSACRSAAASRRARRARPGAAGSTGRSGRLAARLQHPAGVAALERAGGRPARSTSARCSPNSSSGRRPQPTARIGITRNRESELVGDRLHLVPRLEREHVAALVALPLRVLDPRGCVAGDRPRAKPHANACRNTRNDVVPRTRRKLARQSSSSRRLQRVRVTIAELLPRVPQATLDRAKRRRVDVLAVPLLERVRATPHSPRPVRHGRRGEARAPRRASHSATRGRQSSSRSLPLADDPHASTSAGEKRRWPLCESESIFPNAEL